MNKQLRKLHVTAEQIGYCLLCGGTNGNCSCSVAVGSAVRPYQVRAFVDLRKERNGEHFSEDYDSGFLCVACGGLVACDRDLHLVRCQCGNVVKHEYTPPVIPEPDYSLLNTSELPRRALRKPRL